MRMTHKIGVYWILEPTQSPRALVKNADSATPARVELKSLRANPLESELLFGCF